MVLRWAFGLALAATAACSQSLFDNHGAPGGPGPGSDGGIDTPVPAACAEPCLADAQRDFDGTSHGATMHWRYLEDHRDRTWGLMTPGGSPTVMTGLDPGNTITSCQGSAAEACHILPGAVLVSSAGASSAADPALGFTTPDAVVAQITLRVLVPGDTDQTIRLYRNSREDVLFTGTAQVGHVLEQSVTLDALPGDRFLVTVAPTGKGASNAAVQLFASATGAAFPQGCQLALGFDGATGNSLADLCKHAAFTYFKADAMPAAITLAAGPYAELGEGLDIQSAGFLAGSQPLDQNHDLTLQFWSFQRNQDTPDTPWAFSDLDLNFGGGLGVAFIPGAPPVLDAVTSIDPVKNTYIDATAAFATQGTWQFVRVIHAGDAMRVCLNGRLVTNATVPVGQLKTTVVPYLGRDEVWTVDAFFDGVLDDVRVLDGALPCQ
jgi:hypothetical protein